jgi:phosphatidylglycerophosphate synthase
VKSIPTALVIIRFLIGPFLLLDALDGNTSFWFILGFVVAFLSDIFDGIIARRLGVSNAGLRQADSWADVCLYICVFGSAWLVHSDVVTAFRVPLLMVVVAQLLWWIVNLVKYGKPASYHTYSAKAWGITLFIATIALFGKGYGGVTLWVAIIVGIIHTVEEIAMTLVLPTWTHDVLSIVDALRLRRDSISASQLNVLEGSNSSSES